MRKGSRALALVLILTAASAYLGASVNGGAVTSIGETPFVAKLSNPLARLDLIPEAKAAASPAMNLDPRNVVLRPSRSFAAPGTPGRRAGDGFFEASAISLIALNVADYFSTREALRYPGLKEGNPLLKSVVHDPAKFAAVKIGFAAASYISLKSIYKKNRTLGWAASAVSNLALSYVVANNIRLIQGARSRVCAH